MYNDALQFLRSPDDSNIQHVHQTRGDSLPDSLWIEQNIPHKQSVRVYEQPAICIDLTLNTIKDICFCCWF